jgi:hypothetical protein
MMLQSWDGALRIFPAWPKGLDARFENLLAEGAFLVRAAWSGGRVAALEIHSEKGEPCRLYSPWSGGVTVTDAAGQSVEVTPGPAGQVSFPTGAGGAYTLRPSKP